MSHSQFHRIEAYTEACTREAEQAQQKTGKRQLAEKRLFERKP